MKKKAVKKKSKVTVKKAGHFERISRRGPSRKKKGSRPTSIPLPPPPPEPVIERRVDLEIAEVDGLTRVVGILGWPVGHSLSPVMQNAAFQSLHLGWVYVPFPVPPARFDRAMAGLRALGVAGANITVPHKTAAMKLVDEVDPLAKKIGAINTIVRDGDRLVGYNTDAPGFLAGLKEETGMDPHGARVVILGAGGAARAVAVALADAGAKSILVANRTPSKAGKLAANIRYMYRHCTTEALPLGDRRVHGAIAEADLLVNATSLGMGGHDRAPVDPEWVRRGVIVVDLVYNRFTPLLKGARLKGAKAVGGVGMLVAQGALSFEKWVGKKAPVAVMREAVERAVRREQDR